METLIATDMVTKGRLSRTVTASLSRLMAKLRSLKSKWNCSRLRYRNTKANPNEKICAMTVAHAAPAEPQPKIATNT